MGQLRQALGGVAAHARRRPVRAAALSVGVAGVAAAMAIPLSFGGGAAAAKPAPALRSAVTGTSRYPGQITPMRSVPWPWSLLTVNGRPPNDADGHAGLPWFDVVRGEEVTLTVTVTVPAHAEMTKFFLGITDSGAESGVGPHGPIGMTPVLRTASHLTPGSHRFTVHWTVPERATPLGGYEVSGAAYWPRGTKGEPSSEGGPMANVFVDPPGN